MLSVVYYLLFLLPVYMCIMARASGGGLFSESVWSRLPEILFALPLGFVSYLYASDFVYAYGVGLIAFTISLVAMEMGHGTVFTMTGYRDNNRDPDEADKPRIQTIEKIFRPIYVFFGGDIYKPLYSWYIMGIKGFLIALPLGPYALLNAVCWPVSYWIGRRVEHDINEVGEYLSGVFLASIMILFLQIHVL